MPFGPFQAFLCTDPNGEMTKSIRVETKSVGIIRFGQQRPSGFNDLPRLTPPAVKQPVDLRRRNQSPLKCRLVRSF